MESLTTTSWTKLFRVLALFLLVFIPLYPKIPLAELIPGYSVKLRLEDIIVASAGLVWLIGVGRQKVSFSSAYLAGMIGYGMVGLGSILMAVLVIGSIPPQPLHIGKSVLYLFRYLEYFSLFLIGSAAAFSPEQTKVIRWALIGVMLVVVGYGVGQAFGSLPVFSTMNREFAKGAQLSLGDQARVQSTFGGHYDLAAWLILILPVLLSWTLASGDLRHSVVLVVTQGAGGWLLLQSGAKTAALGYVVAVMMLILVKLGAGKKLEYWRRWLVGSSLGLLILIGVVIFQRQPLYQRWSSLPLPTALSSKVDRLLSLTPWANQLGIELPVAPTNLDLSPNAQKYGLSLGIRLDTLWPLALRGFIRFPWLGSGYGTLNTLGYGQFTESESTDNNYLRMLGESGVLGLATFLLLVGWIWRKSQLLPRGQEQRWLAWGWRAGLIALLINAVYIDVFAASKVAFSFWLWSGILVGMWYHEQPQQWKQDQIRFWHWLRTVIVNQWWLMGLLTLLALATHQDAWAEFGVIRSLSVASAITPLVTAHCWVSPHCVSSPSALNWWEWPYTVYLAVWYRLAGKPMIFYPANLVLLWLGTWGWWRLTKLTRLPSRVWLMTIWFALWTVSDVLWQPSSWVLVIALAPWLIIIIGVRFRIKGKQLSVSSQPWWQVMMLGGSTLLLLFTSVVTNLPHRLRDNFQPGKEYAFAAVRRLNQDVMTDSVVVTTLSADFVNLYQSSAYVIKTASDRWAEISKYQSSVEQSEQPWYLSGYHIPEKSKLFALYNQAFDLELTAVDCQEQCNTYRLRPLGYFDLSMPRTYGVDDRQVVSSDQPRVAVLSRRYNPAAVRNDTYTYLPELAKLVGSEQPDLVVGMGDLISAPSPDHFQHWQQLATRLPGVIYVPGNLDQFSAKYPAADYTQAWTMGRVMFIALDPGPDGKLEFNQYLQIASWLLWLEKHPELSDLVIFNHSLSWLAEHPTWGDLAVFSHTSGPIPEDSVLVEQILPRLRQLTNRKVWLVSGDWNSLNHPSVLFQAEENSPITYLVAAMNGTSDDVYLSLEIVGKEGLTWQAKDGQGKPIQDWQNYTAQFWLDHQPELGN